MSIDLSGDTLEQNVTDDGTYYSVDGNTIVAQYRPVQPLVDVPIESNQEFGGFLITDLLSQDLARDYVPFISRPMVDNSVDEGRIVAHDGAFPATLQRITDVGGGQRLLVAAGQYESNQRLFRRIKANSSLAATPPTTGHHNSSTSKVMTVSDVGATGRGVQFDIVTDGEPAGSSSSTARSATTTGRRSNSPARRPPAAAGSGSAVRRCPTRTAKVEFFAQSVDLAGNVGITSNKIENFEATNAVEVPNGLRFVYRDSPVGLDPAGQSGGRFFASGARFEILIVRGRGRPRTMGLGRLRHPFIYDPTNDITVVFDQAKAGQYDGRTDELYLDAGAHVLFAEGASGNRVYRFFILDPTAPTVTITTGPVRANGDVEVTITARDTASGVAENHTDMPGELPDRNVRPDVGDGTATLTFTSTGTGDTTISATATDKVGNTTHRRSRHRSIARHHR